MRKEIQVDEASIVERISTRDRSLKASIPQQEQVEKPLPEEESSPPGNDADEIAEADITDNTEAEKEIKPAQPQPKPTKRKRGHVENYGDVFLKRKEFKNRQSVYISQEVHASVSRLVHVLALTGNEISVGGYIDNVIAEHLENYKELFAEMYRKQLDQFV